MSSKTNGTCPKCGKKFNLKKTGFCPSCGFEIFTPEVKREWHFNTVGGIFLILIVLYLLFLLLKPILYFYLDKV